MAGGELLVETGEVMGSVKMLARLQVYEHAQKVFTAGGAMPGSVSRLIVLEMAFGAVRQTLEFQL